MKKVKYLAIEREYGSGGTEIARRIGANTGVACYGKEILEHVSCKLHMSVDELERYEEKVTGSILYTFYMMAQAHSASSDMLTKEGQIYVEEQSQIQRLAKQGSAIFLGHCACEALKEEDGIIKVFIFCSDKEQKQERIMRDYGIKKADVNSVRERFDRKRANYYQANTGGKWKDSANYDIMLDSARLGIDGCVGILEGLLLC